jgi:hypothetical protein
MPQRSEPVPAWEGIRLQGRQVSVRTVMAVVAAMLATTTALADDLFVGTFESETRANFGSDTPGEYRIEIAAPRDGQYLTTMYRRGKQIGQGKLTKCSVDSEGYLANRPPGRAEVLCHDVPNGPTQSFISYSENGIVVQVVKPKYVENRDLVAQDGLKPGDPLLFEPRHHKTQYYAHVPWLFYGFRKVSR